MFIYLTNVQNDVDKINAARIHYPIRVTWFITRRQVILLQTYSRNIYKLCIQQIINIYCYAFLIRQSLHAVNPFSQENRLKNLLTNYHNEAEAVFIVR